LYQPFKRLFFALVYLSSISNTTFSFMNIRTNRMTLFKKSLKISYKTNSPGLGNLLYFDPFEINLFNLSGSMIFVLFQIKLAKLSSPFSRNESTKRLSSTQLLKSMIQIVLLSSYSIPSPPGFVKRHDLI
jgi:hypothetical protein